MLVKDHPQAGTGPFPLSFFFSAIKETIVKGSYTVSFLTDDPYAPLLSNLAYPTGLIISPSAVKIMEKMLDVIRQEQVHLNSQNGKATSTSSLIVMMLTGVEKRHQVSCISTDHWCKHPGCGNAAGGLDLMQEVAYKSVSRFSSNSSFNVQEQAGPHLWFNFNLRKVHSNKQVRKAVNHDQQKISGWECFENTATATTGPTPAAFAWAYNESPIPIPIIPQPVKWLRTSFCGSTLTFYVTEGGSGMLDPVPMGTNSGRSEKVGLNGRLKPRNGIRFSESQPRSWRKSRYGWNGVDDQWSGYSSFSGFKNGSLAW